MEKSPNDCNVPRAFLDSLRLLQYEQRKIGYILKDTDNADLKELLLNQLSDCEKYIDQTQGLITRHLAGLKGVN